MKRAVATTVAAGLTAFLWMPAEPGAAPAASDAACLARPTVTCGVDLALTASTGRDDDERARLVRRAAQQLKEPTARKAYLDSMAARFFPDGSPGWTLLVPDRRVTGIAAAAIAGDDAAADRQLADVQGNFQRWWETLSSVIRSLAQAGRPDLAAALEARHHRSVKVNRRDAMGRNLGEAVWDTRQPLARALVRCACGPDPLPTVLALPEQADRLGLAAVLYARRHDAAALQVLLTREFGKLATVKDKTQRNWIGYAYGLMLKELPLSDIPATVRARPAWLTAHHFQRPADKVTPSSANIYGAVLARAVAAGDRGAVAALVKLRPRGDSVWLSDMTIERPDGLAKVNDLLPGPERAHVRTLETRFMLAHGDARKGLDATMKSPAARAWRKPQIDDEAAAEFEETVLAPLLARGAFDVAAEAAGRLRDADARKSMQETVAAARRDAANPAPKDAASKLTALWAAYQQSKPDDAAAGRRFLFAVRDLIAAQPDDLPFE